MTLILIAIARSPPARDDMSGVSIYHNPRCSQSRATLALIRAQGIEPEIIDYLATPPSVADIERILVQLDVPPRALMRSGEAEYAELKLDDPALRRVELVAALHGHPRLLQRPIVLANGKAAIGRPPENVLAILQV